MELLVGIALFLTLLTLATLALHASHQTVAVTQRRFPVQLILQIAMDNAVRHILPARDVALSGSTLELLQEDGSWKSLWFAGGTLFFDGVPLQSGLGDARFSVNQGPVSKWVRISLSVTRSDPQYGTITRTLVSSAALRNGMTGAPSPPPAQAQAEAAPSSETSPIPHPLPREREFRIPPCLGARIPCP